jgi:ABC-type uncharacterized transport system ATPase component
MTHQEYVASFLEDAKILSDQKESRTNKARALSRIRQKRNEVIGWNITIERYIQTLEQRETSLRAQLAKNRRQFEQQKKLLTKIRDVLRHSG